MRLKYDYAIWGQILCLILIFVTKMGFWKFNLKLIFSANFQ